MAVLTLEDLHGSVEGVVFPRSFERSPDLWREDAVLVVDGKVDTRDERAQVLLERAVEWTPPANGQAPPEPEVEPDVVQVNGTHRSLAQGPASNGTARSSPTGGGHTNGRGLVNGAGGSSPAQGANDIGGGNGTNGHAPDTGDESDGAVVAVQVPRPDDATAMRVLEQLHNLVELNPGTDRLDLMLYERDGVPVTLVGADIRVQLSPELEAQLRQMVGDENVNLCPGGQGSGATHPNHASPRPVEGMQPEGQYSDALAADAAWHDSVLAPTREDESTTLAAF
jgi:DNA polymerase-3 subunit alpha